MEEGRIKTANEGEVTMEGNLAKTILENGIMIVIAIIFLGGVIHYAKKVEPRIRDLEIAVGRKNHLIDELSTITQMSTRAIEEVARSTDNVASSIEVLNVTMQAHMELIKLLLEDGRETQLRLYSHDDKLDKVYTILYKACSDTVREKDQ